MVNRQDQRAEFWQIALESITTLSYRSSDLHGYLQEIACSVSRLLKSDWSIVTLHAESRGQVIASSLDIDTTDSDFLLHESISEVVVQTGQPFLIEDIKQYPEAADRMSGYASYLGVPLRVSHDKVIGTICSFNAQPSRYSAEIISTVELFAERAATAIDNYQLYQQQQQFNDRLEAEVMKRTIELRAAQAKLIEHERLAAIGEFATMIVHEIRNPLTTVQMGLSYLAKLKLSQPAQVRLSLAVSEADRLANLLQEILTYSKPQILQLAEIEINQFIESQLASLRSMPQGQGRLIQYVPLKSPAWILGDADKLKQVFINLVRNACEAVEPEATIYWYIQQDWGDQISISVQNGGVPIPANVLPYLTQPFYSTKPEGTGLGLSIVKRIVEAHSGKLLIKSSSSEGTTFSIQLPLQHKLIE